MLIVASRVLIVNLHCYAANHVMGGTRKVFAQGVRNLEMHEKLQMITKLRCMPPAITGAERILPP